MNVLRKGLHQRAFISSHGAELFERDEERLRSDSVLFLDIRERCDYDAKHIRTALSFPASQWRTWGGSWAEEASDEALEQFVVALQDIQLPELLQHANKVREIQRAAAHRMKIESIKRGIHGEGRQNIVLCSGTPHEQHQAPLADCRDLLASVRGIAAAAALFPELSLPQG